MFPYILLLLIPTFFAFVAFDRTEKPVKIRIGMPRNQLIFENNLLIPVFFIMLLALLMVRDETIGRDIVSYKFYFEVYSQQNPKYFDLFRTESLFRMYCWIIGRFTDDIQVFIAITAVASVVPLALVYNRERKFGYMQMVIFVSMSTFPILFSTFRQILSMAVGMLAYDFVRKKNLIGFLVCVVIAFGFHHSAFMLLFYYPLYHVQLRKKHLFVIVPLVAAIFVWNRPVFSMLNAFIAEYDDTYAAMSGSTGAYMMIILFLVFSVFSFIIPDEKKLDGETIGLRNFLLMAVVLQMFAPLHPLAMRLNYYYIIFIPIILAKVMAIPAPQFRRVIPWAKVILSLYFTYDFLYKTYVSYVTKTSPLDTIPYIPFWK